MCLFPGSQQLELQAERGSEVDKWRKIMIGVSACHAMIGILNLISGNAWDGIFDLLAAGIGYYGCREPARIQPTMILCYVVFVIMDCFWASLAAMLLLAGVKEVNGPRWRKGLFIGVTYTSVIFYAVAIYVSYKLYTLLKRQYDSLSGLEAGGVPFTDASAERSGAGGGGGGGFPAPGVVSRPSYPRASGGRPSSLAFKGQGYRLGDGKRVK